MTISDLRTVQLDILAHVDRVCRREGIEYSLAGGSLLGAVRHGGYIPWDDDIDIELPRPHYESLLSALARDLPPHLALLHHTSQPTFLPWAKVYDKRTFYTSRIDTQHLGTGAFIDIFPMDVLPADEERLSAHRKEYFRRAAELACSAPRGLAYASSTRWLYFVAKCVLWLPRHLRCRGRFVEIARDLDAFMQRFSATDEQCIGFFFRAFPRAIYRRSLWTAYEDIPFEHLTARKLVAHDEYLTLHYGDYMTPPPVSEQKATHGFYRWYWKTEQERPAS